MDNDRFHIFRSPRKRISEVEKIAVELGITAETLINDEEFVRYANFRLSNNRDLNPLIQEAFKNDSAPLGGDYGEYPLTKSAIYVTFLYAEQFVGRKWENSHVVNSIIASTYYHRWLRPFVCAHIKQNGGDPAKEFPKETCAFYDNLDHTIRALASVAEDIIEYVTFHGKEESRTR